MSEPDRKPGIVSKFASFKPKPKTDSIEGSDGEKRTRERSSRYRSHSRRDRGHSRERHGDRDHYRECDRPRHQDKTSERDKNRDQEREQEKSSRRDRDHKNRDLIDKGNRDKGQDKLRGRDRDQDRSYHRPRQRGSSRDRHHSQSTRETSHYQLRSNKISSIPNDAPSKQTKPPDISNQDFFVIDTKGDPLVHLGLDRYSIPNFGRERRKFLLGTSLRLFIHRDGPHEQFTLLRPEEFYGSPPLRSKKLTFSMTRPLRSSKHSESTDIMDDIIFVNKKRKRGKMETSDEEGPNFRSIEGPAKPKYYSDSEPESGDEAEISCGSESEATEEQSSLKRRSIDLTRQVKVNPGDIPAWIDLIYLQNELMWEGLAPNQKVSTGKAHSFSEIKLSMIHKALKASTTDADKEALLLLQMYEGRKIWSTDVTRKKWNEIASGDYGQRFGLWIARVNFEMTEVQGFHVDNVKKMFIDRLHGIMEKSRRYGAHQSLDLYAEAIYIFLRLTRLLHEAGYRELAVAAWQSLLELNFFRPDTVDNEEHEFASFAEFWESEVLRIGENNALGWSHFINHQDNIEVPEPEKEDPTTVRTPNQGIRSIYKSWAVSEMRCSQNGRLPARTLDDGTGDDPFRMIMASDLDGLLLQFPLSVIPKLQEQIVDSFLIFSHLPPHFNSSAWVSKAKNDMFLAPTDPSLHQSVSQASKGVLENQKRDRCSLVSLLLPSALPLNLSSLIRSWHRKDINDAPVDFVWIRNTLYQLSTTSTGVSVKGLLSLVMTLDWLRDPVVRKSARQIIQSDPSNAELYRLYGLLESQNGNSEAGYNVFASVIALNENPPSNLPISEVAFSWIWTELVDDASGSRALSRLVFLLDGLDSKNEVSGARILSGIQMLSGSFDLIVASGNFAGFSTVARCRVLLAYLSDISTAQPQNQTQGNISAAMELLWSQSKRLNPMNPEQAAIQENLLSFGASLLYLYICRGPYQRAFLNLNIQRCLECFPQNSFFIELYDYINSSHLLRSDFRKLADTLLLSRSNDCVGNRICTVVHELRHGTVHSAQASLERSISASSASASIELWSAYVHLCAGSADLRHKAYETYYRAVSHCPWSKDLSIQAFMVLAEDMDVENLEAAFQALANKGLRAHIDLADFAKRALSKE
ncbi:hypothetical protein BROUX41_000527 [Berkeleyomyces rouxiae]